MKNVRVRNKNPLSPVEASERISSGTALTRRFASPSPGGRGESAFTLIEMSIVIVIIGLVVGGIMMGKSIEREAEIQDMVGEYGSYLQSVKEFQDKYHALPGDMSTATSFWPTFNGAAITNGDGSGTIGSSDSSGNPGTPGEWWQAWLQMSAAGLVQGNFTGTGTGSAAVIGTNVPASKLDGAGWTLNYYLNTSGDVGLWSDQYGHVFNLGSQVSNDYTKGAVLTTTEALGVDQKLDDGLPGTGKVRAWRTSVLSNCTATDTSQTLQAYNTAHIVANSANVGYNNPYCALVFLAGF